MTEIAPKSLAALAAASGIATATPDAEAGLQCTCRESRRRNPLPPISAGSWFRRRVLGSAAGNLQPEGPIA